MRFALRPSALALSLLLLTHTAAASADSAPPSVAGSGAVSLGDGRQRRFEFRAVAREDGGATGYITFTDPTELPAQDVDGTGEAGLDGPPAGLELTVDIDSLKVSGRRAALSGLVSRTNHPRYAGVRVLLTVEDRGDGQQGAARDRLTWGVYRSEAGGWLASDADLPDAETTFVAERAFDIERLPLSSFSLARIDEGDIQVSE